jgi:hypothetical protein
MSEFSQKIDDVMAGIAAEMVKPNPNFRTVIALHLQKAMAEAYDRGYELNLNKTS